MTRSYGKKRVRNQQEIWPGILLTPVKLFRPDHASRAQHTKMTKNGSQGV